MFFFDPSQISPAKCRRRASASASAAWWSKGSVQKTPGTLDVRFLVTDFKHTMPVSYSGILPDLFREGQGVVAHGRMQAAPSWPTKCSPSTTRNTCRRKWRSR